MAGRATGDSAARRWRELHAGCNAVGKEEGHEIGRPILFLETLELIERGS